jgi:ABC-2 type transport system permease protein
VTTNQAAARPRGWPTLPFGPRATATGLANEVYKGLLAAWGERIQILIEMPLFTIFFLLFAAVVGRGDEIAATGQISWSFDTEHVSWLFVGYLAFTFFYLQSVKLFWRLLGEIQSGTLEQVYLSPLPSWLVVAAGRVTAAVVETIFVVTMLYAVTSLFVDFDIPWRAAAIIPLVFVVIASVGYSLLLGGLTLILKRVEMLADLMLIPIFMASGLLVPLDQTPDWIAATGRLLPVTHGVESMRAIVFEGGSIGVMWGDGGLVWVMATAIGWLGAGVICFRLGERIAKRQGSLGHS